MAASTHTIFTHTFANAVSVATPDLQPETVTMLAAINRKGACPRLTSDAPRITTAELLALLDEPSPKRKGNIVGLVVRHIPKLGDTGLGLSAAIV